MFPEYMCVVHSLCQSRGPVSAGSSRPSFEEYPGAMATWPIPLRGSTEVLDLDPPSGDLEVADVKPMSKATPEPQPKAQQPAPTKHTSSPGITYRSYGGTVAWMQKRLRTELNSGAAESPRPKKSGRAVDEPGPPDRERPR